MPKFRSLVLLLVLLAAAGISWSKPIHILATGDMHGWLQAQQQDGQTLGGTAEMLAYWQRVEQYKPEKFLVLGCGDFNTGPVLATAFKGTPVVAVMNRMGYDACVLGNHEFDFGREQLAALAKEAKFPLLAANITQPDGSAAGLATPYMLYTEQGVTVGIIGLLTTALPVLTENAGGLVMHPYAETLRQYVPEMRAKGARVIIVVAHVPVDELVALAGQVKDLDIPLLFGGHSHELSQVRVKDGDKFLNTWVVSNGERWDAYSRIDLDYDARSGRTTVITTKQVWLQQDHPKADKTVKAEIDRWQQLLDDRFGKQIGYTVTGVQRPDGVYNFVADCMLAADQTADCALTNSGSMRQDILPGPINEGIIMSVMPFTNNLYSINLTGEQLLAYLPKDNSFIGMAGLRLEDGQIIHVKTGRSLDAKVTYRVVLNSFMYNTSQALKDADPHPVMLAFDWRQPVVDWLLKHSTSQEQPLERLVDVQPRITSRGIESPW